MTRIHAFLTSTRGRLLEHYAIIFAGAAAASFLASSQHVAGIHGIHAYAAALLGAGSVAIKAGYDALRQAAIPAITAWLAARKHRNTPPSPTPPAAK